MRRVRRNRRRVLVFRVMQVVRHAMTVEESRQVFEVLGIEASRDQRRNKGTIFAAKLRAQRGNRRVVAAGLSQQRLAPVNIGGDRGLGGEGTRLVDRGVDVLP